jgi:outer membrane lipoprotein SlyB
MTKNNVVIGTIVAVTVALIITASTIPTVLAQQAGNMTGGNAGNMTGGGGGDLVQKMLSAAIQAKTLKTVINNKDVYVIACDPDMTDPATQCEVYTIQPAEQQP